MSYETDLIDAMPRCRHGMAPAICTLCPYDAGYRAGIEAAAKEAERHGYMCRLVVIDAIRALAAAPKGEAP